MRPVVLTTCAAAAALTTIVAAPAAAAPPAACQNLAQIADVTGDGHHPNTDLVSGWFSERAGLQAVIRPRVASFAPVHDDSDAAGFALLYEVAGVRRYVRAEAPRTGDMRYDHGTWTPGGGFAAEGTTTGRIDAGTVVIDVPAIAPGTKLGRPFALTYDGLEAGEPHWVDRAPGGVTPAGDEYGADLVTGACGLGAGGSTGGTGATTGGGTTGGTSGGTAGTAGTTAAVRLSARSTITGSRKVTVSGSVLPARGGVAVSLRAKATRTTFTKATTRADGSFRAAVPIGETTALRATADGIASQTVTVTVRSKVRVKVRRARSGAVVITGQVWPALPGRVLWLREGAASPTAQATVRKGRFRLRFKRPQTGRYQAVFIPSGRRAERSTSNTGVIR